MLEKIYEIKLAMDNTTDEDFLDELDPAEVGGLLQDAFDRENIIYLMGSEFGQGVLAGAFLESLTRMQEEIMREMEEADE